MASKYITMIWKIIIMVYYNDVNQKQKNELLNSTNFWVCLKIYT